MTLDIPDLKDFDKRLRAEAIEEPSLEVPQVAQTKKTRIVAIYGKGGIGKSFPLATLSHMMAEMGKRVLLIGCDPKSDATSLLFGGVACPTIIETSTRKKLAGEEVKIGDVCFKRGGVFAMDPATDADMRGKNAANTVARRLIESGADVAYVGTACARNQWSDADRQWLEAKGVAVKFRASLEDDLMAMEGFAPDLAVGTTPVVQKARERGTPARYFTNLISARPLMGPAGAGSLAGIWEGASNLRPDDRAAHQKKLDKAAKLAKAEEMI